MDRLFKYLKPYIFSIILIIGFTLLQVVVNLQLPDYMSKIINEGIVQENNQLIWDVGKEMLAISLVGGVATILVSFFASKVSTGVARNLREKVFSKVTDFSLNEFDKFSTSSLITRTTNDIQQVQQVTFMILRLVISAPIMGIWAFIKAYDMAPSMSWIIGVAVLLILLLITIMFLFAFPQFKILQKLTDNLNQVARENLTGLRVIRAFNTQDLEEKKFKKANKEFTAVNLFVNRIMVILQPFVMVIISITSIGIVWFGAHLISTNDLKIGDMMAFMQYALQSLMSFLMISMVFIMIPRSWVSGGRIADVLETKPQITDPKAPQEFNSNMHGEIEFKNVSFSYPHSIAKVLTNINLIAKSGETTAIIGSTGSGKSTLINLIPRFYDVSEGEILIDGTNIKDVVQEDLNKKIGYVPQKGVLFSESLGQNIKLGKENATTEEVEHALKTAQAFDFVSKMEGGIETNIAQGGTNVSGGQKQRLSIARALLKKPEIYIFDDSFSALDFKTDSALRDALVNETKQSTVLIVGQRISTIMHAEKIIVLDEGKIVGQGTHEELMKNCSVYKEIALSQFSEEELKTNSNSNKTKEAK
jgi:ATP-binding cassette subfamily B protein